MEQRRAGLKRLIQTGRSDLLHKYRNHLRRWDSLTSLMPIQPGDQGIGTVFGEYLQGLTSSETDESVETEEAGGTGRVGGMAANRRRMSGMIKNECAFYGESLAGARASGLEESYQGLITAVIRQAVKDYVSVLLRLFPVRPGKRKRLWKWKKRNWRSSSIPIGSIP